MPLPSFTDANVNAYLTSIANSQTDLNTLASDLSSNFLNALTTRFDLNPWQISRVNNMNPYAQADIANLFTRAASNHAAISTDPINPFFVTGIVTSGGSGPASGTKTEGSVTVDSTGKVTVDVKVTVDIC